MARHNHGWVMFLKRHELSIPQLRHEKRWLDVPNDFIMVNVIMFFLDLRPGQM